MVFLCCIIFSIVVLSLSNSHPTLAEGNIKRKFFTFLYFVRHSNIFTISPFFLLISFPDLLPLQIPDVVEPDTKDEEESPLMGTIRGKCITQLLLLGAIDSIQV